MESSPTNPSEVDAPHRVERIRVEGTRLISVAAGDLGAEIASCPGWDCERLLGHTSRVWLSVAGIVSARATDGPPEVEVPSAPNGGSVVEFASDALASLTDELAGLDPATELWTWSRQQNAAFYLRRMHIETIVHRVDAEVAVGDRSPVDSDDASDGVDELFSVLLVGRQGDGLPSGSLHLHRTDGDGEWLLDVVDGRVAVRHEHAKGDAALRGSGADLLLAMWGRGDVDAMECFGDRAVVDSWIALAP